MIARIVAAMTVQMEKLEKLEKEKRKKEKKKKSRKRSPNTSRGVGRYMGKDAGVLDIDN